MVLPSTPKQEPSCVVLQASKMVVMLTESLHTKWRDEGGGREGAGRRAGKDFLLCADAWPVRERLSFYVQMLGRSSAEAEMSGSEASGGGAGMPRERLFILTLPN